MDVLTTTSLFKGQFGIPTSRSKSKMLFRNRAENLQYKKHIFLFCLQQIKFKSWDFIPHLTKRETATFSSWNSYAAPNEVVIPCITSTILVTCADSPS